MSSASSWPKAVLFDLDGTLIDSAPDIGVAVNQLLALAHLPPLSLKQIVSMIGEGARVLVARAFAASGQVLDEAELEQRYEQMQPLYAANTIGLTTLYPHVSDVLQSLKERGTAIALVTNKPNFAIGQILDHFKIADYFSAIVGADSGVTPKPAPDMVELALSRLDILAKDAVFVGDSPADAQAAKAADVRLILMRGGYSRVPLETLDADLVLGSFSELLPALDRSLKA